MTKPRFNLRKSYKGLLFGIRRKMEDLPVKGILIILSFVVLIAFAEVYLARDPLHVSPSPNEESFISRIGRSLWWAIVTLTTVGYGDSYPDTSTGKFLAVILMGFGIVFLSILSGSIASIFVERKLREGKGMKEVTTKYHIVICGWNDTAYNLLKSLPLAGGSTNLTIVLINELDPDELAAIKYRYKELDIKYVRGDYCHEDVLKRGNIAKAKSIILLADISGGHSFADADQRTIIAAFAIKNLAGDLKVSAELNKKENEEHLKRACVDDILIYGEFGGFLLSHAALSQGVPSLIMELLTFSVGNTVAKKEIPDSFVGGTFSELSKHFHDKHRSLLI